MIEWKGFLSCSKQSVDLFSSIQGVGQHQLSLDTHRNTHATIEHFQLTIKGARILVIAYHYLILFVLVIS